MCVYICQGSAYLLDVVEYLEGRDTCVFGVVLTQGSFGDIGCDDIGRLVCNAIIEDGEDVWML